MLFRSHSPIRYIAIQRIQPLLPVAAEIVIPYIPYRLEKIFFSVDSLPAGHHFSVGWIQIIPISVRPVVMPACLQLLVGFVEIVPILIGIHKPAGILIPLGIRQVDCPPPDLQWFRPVMPVPLQKQSCFRPASWLLTERLLSGLFLTFCCA